MRNIDFNKQAVAFLDKLNFVNKKLLSKIIEAIDELRVEALPKDCKKLVGHKNLYRIRIGKYRIIYSFDEEVLTIITIAKREDVYDVFKN